MTYSVWGLSLTRDGVGVCALGDDTDRHLVTVPWTRSPSSLCRASGVWAVRPHDVCEAVARGLVEMLRQSPPPLALGLCSPDGETSVCLDTRGDTLSDIFFDPLLIVPRHEVPALYQDAPELLWSYRRSFLHQMRQTRPEFCLGMRPGISSIGGYVADRLTAHHVDCAMPRDLPMPCDARAWEALGYDANASVRRARCGHAFARVSPNVAERLRAHLETPPDFDMSPLGILAGISVFGMGSTDSARAYATAADPLSWSVEVGYGMRAHWTSGTHALAAYEIEIVEHGAQPAEDKAPPDSSPQTWTRDDWTRAIAEVHGDLEVRPGPRAQLLGYGFCTESAHLRCIDEAIRELGLENGRLPYEAIRRAPLGSGGLHVMTDPHGVRMVGMQPAHGAPHLVRALFESHLYAVRARREMQGVTCLQDAVQNAPIRLVLSPPWPEECAQWASDILNTQVMSIDTGLTPVACISAFGCALALARELDVPLGNAPTLSAVIYEPGARAPLYTAHYKTHQAIF